MGGGGSSGNFLQEKKGGGGGGSTTYSGIRNEQNLLQREALDLPCIVTTKCIISCMFSGWRMTFFKEWEESVTALHKEKFQ